MLETYAAWLDSSRRFQDKLCGQICLEYMRNSRIMNLHEEHTVKQVKQVHAE